MAAVEDAITEAFAKLVSFPNYVERPDQQQLALMLSDCQSEKKSGVFEAPTGLGKSLAILVPAIAHAMASGKRTVIATYTNVLAEQYWRKDMPLALSLFEDPKPKAKFLIGRQRYACKAAMSEITNGSVKEFKLGAELGIESEFRQHSRKIGRELTQQWQQIVTPPVCPGRLCPQFHDCYYYNARRDAEKASIVITNHSVVLQDALLKKASDGELNMLGDYDFLVIDEAHDFPSAALNALEFELSESKLGLMAHIVQRMQVSLQVLALNAGEPHVWNGLCEGYKERVAEIQLRMRTSQLAHRPGILKATPALVWDHPQVQARASGDVQASAQTIATEVAQLTTDFVRGVQDLLNGWQSAKLITSAQSEDASDSIRNYAMYLHEFSAGCELLFAPTTEADYSVGVTYSSSNMDRSWMLRHDVIGVHEPLKDLIWSQTPTACVSATLSTDGDFTFYRRITGIEPDFEEILPSPFDFASQSALYLPAEGAIPDPAIARKQGTENAYFDALANEIGDILEAMEGRTLVLFHSRKEMEAVFERLGNNPSHPIYMQKYSSAGWVGERFVKDINSSLFALRSFWTGFDAPGETLSCVVLVRVPFEVPVDPPQVARMAWLQTEGHDPFKSYSLPQAKMMMRQGAGRLIRRSEDKGIIAILDPRVQTKMYGAEILENLPAGIRTFRDFADAMAHVGLEAALV